MGEHRAVPIEDVRQIFVNASEEDVFAVIETMPNKFPVYKVLETKPFFFFRMLMVDGLREAIRAIRFEKPINQLVLQPGETMGPFTLIEVTKPHVYMFELNAFFFHCRTGYVLSGDKDATLIQFVLHVHHLGFKEKVYWAFFKTVHRILAGKVLKVIKAKVEHTPISNIKLN